MLKARLVSTAFRTADEFDCSCTETRRPAENISDFSLRCTSMLMGSALVKQIGSNVWLSIAWICVVVYATIDCRNYVQNYEVVSATVRGTRNELSQSFVFVVLHLSFSLLLTQALQRIDFQAINYKINSHLVGFIF